MSRHTFKVNTAQHGQRLDHFIAQALGGIAKRRAKSLVDDGDVFVNGLRQKIASHLLKKGDSVAVIQRTPPGEPPRGARRPVLSTEAILHLDHNLIIINKPAGIATQPTRNPAAPHVTALLAVVLDEMGEEHRGLMPAHRLDKDTTGCLVIARNRQSMTHMTQHFRERAVSKLYHAICYGRPVGPFEEHSPLTPIDPATGRVRAVRSGGRPACTHFTPLELFPSLDLALVACRPLSGRSHQIRVHLEKNAFPIVGDKVYGNPSAQRPLPQELLTLLNHHLLHAQTIAFVMPGEKQVTSITAPYPADMEQFLQSCRSLHNDSK